MDTQILELLQIPWLSLKEKQQSTDITPSSRASLSVISLPKRDINRLRRLFTFNSCFFPLGNESKEVMH